MTRFVLPISDDELAAFCRRHSVARLSLFGSALRDDFRADSDIDILIQFLPDATPSLLDLGAMQQELCDLTGRQVDLKTPEFLSPAIRDRVLREAQLRYAA